MLRKFKTFFSNLKLAQKFTILLLIVFLGGIALSGAALASVLNYKAQDEITTKALMLMATMNSVRNYTSNEVNPELKPRLDEEFLPESVPSYSAREVFENLRLENQPYKEFLYKEAALNPTNLRDKADDFEAAIVEGFRQDKNLQEVEGFRSIKGQNLFYIARPITISQESCLECHSTPSIAPKSLISIYGTAHGFGWKLNEIIGTQIISVPAAQVLQKARQSFILIMGIVSLVFAIAIFLVNLWLKRYVVRPLRRLAQVAEAVSTGDMEAEFEPMSNDEVGKLGEAFGRMKMSLVMAMKRFEQYRIGRRNVSDIDSK